MTYQLATDPSVSTRVRIKRVKPSHPNSQKTNHVYPPTNLFNLTYLQAKQNRSKLDDRSIYKNSKLSQNVLHEAR